MIDEPIALEPEELKHGLMPRLARGDVACAARGVWRAYGGTPGRSRYAESPRGRLMAALERAVGAEPASQIVITGHSMGGSLATLCAHDLLCAREIAPRQRPVVCVTFGATRSFNGTFRRVNQRLQHTGRLLALRVVNAGDVVPRLAFDMPLG